MTRTIRLSCAWTALGVLVAAAGAARQASSPPLRALLDYHGKGAIQVTLPEASISVGFEQSYVAPDSLLFSFDIAPLKQWALVLGDRERTYTPGLGYVVEKRFRNLEKLPASPSLAVQMSMAQFGRVIHELKQVQILGSETLLGHECRIVRFSNRELIENLLSRGLIGETGAVYLNKGTAKAWVTEAHGLPVRIQLCSNEGKPAVLIEFSELKINTGARPAELKIPVPSGTLLIQVTADVTAPNWEEKLGKEVQLQVDAIKKAHSGRRG